MVQYNPRTWFSLIFHSYSRQVVKTLFPGLFAMGAYTAVITFLMEDFFDVSFNSTTVVHSLLGVVLGLFLVFRINSAYDRWWEGRKLWGSLLNNSRNLATKINAFLPANAHNERAYFAQLIPNFAYALKDHLREGANAVDLDLSDLDVLERLKGKEHIPNALLSMMYDSVTQLTEKGSFNREQFFLLDKELKEFSDILGGCERIRNTPIPYSYSMFIKKFIFTFTITLPFAFITEFHYFTIPIVLMVFFILVSVELVAEEIEDPFGNDVNDLPTTELSKKIKNNVRELLIQ
ncbi:MAG: putative membrane protein [Marivirga sp.]|jgi:putative membrane protein